MQSRTLFGGFKVSGFVKMWKEIGEENDLNVHWNIALCALYNKQNPGGNTP